MSDYQLTRVEIATILAALREWQAQAMPARITRTMHRYISDTPPKRITPHVIATCKGEFPPLASKEIDLLCSRLECLL